MFIVTKQNNRFPTRATICYLYDMFIFTKQNYSYKTRFSNHSEIMSQIFAIVIVTERLINTVFQTTENFPNMI